MQRLLTCLLALGCVGTGGFVIRGTRNTPNTVEVQMATDGAFRDGLYLGKLDRAARRTVAPPIARWSTDQDRASFARGYRQGFGQTQNN